MGHGFALFAGTATNVIQASAREAEALGYTSFWVNHPGSTDGLAALAHAADVTSRLDLGVGVIPLHTRGPAGIVEGTKATRLPLPRLLLGVGSPNPKSLERVRDGVAELRKHLQTRIVVAALGPKMCRLAGEIADGVLFNWLTPEYARRSAELVREGAAAARRKTPVTYAYVRLAMGAPGLARLDDEGGRYAGIPAYAAHFERMGVKPVDTAVAGQSPAEIRAKLEKWQGAVDEIVLRAITGRDTAEETLELVRAAKPS